MTFIEFSLWWNYLRDFPLFYGYLVATGDDVNKLCCGVRCEKCYFLSKTDKTESIILYILYIFLYFIQFANPLFVWTKANSNQLKQQFVWWNLFQHERMTAGQAPWGPAMTLTKQLQPAQWLRLCSLDVLWIIIATKSHFPHRYPHFSRQYGDIPKHNTPPLFVYVVYFCITVLKVWLSFIVFVQMYVLSM